MVDRQKSVSELSEAELDARRAALETELARKARVTPQANAGGAEPAAAASSLGLALRIGSEFFSAIIIGAVLGLGFDHLAGTKPWGLAFLLLIGCAAGVMNVLRAIGRPLPYQTKQDKGRQKSGGK